MGVALGIKIQEQISKLMKATPVTSQELDRTVMMLTADRVDFTALTTDIVEDFVEQGLPIRVIDPPIIDQKFFLCLDKKHIDLIPKIDEALLKVKATQ